MSDDPADTADRYLDLLAGCVTRDLFADEHRRTLRWRMIVGHLRRPGLWRSIRSWRLTAPMDPNRVQDGRHVVSTAETMIGRTRLTNIRDCVRTAVVEGIPGDLAEAGIWRGGATIYMRGVLASLGDEQRLVWACDSFEGLPAPDQQRSQVDERRTVRESHDLDVGIDEVRAAFARYGFLDERVRFVKGWFRDTLPKVAQQVKALAVLRLDGDLYESIMDTLDNLEPLVSPGGFVIVDDYFVWDGCRRAVDEYRARNDITADLHAVDWCAAFWRKPLDRSGDSL